MMKGITRVLLGDFSSREVRRHLRVVEEVNALEPQMQALSDAQLAGLTETFRQRLADGETLEDLLPEAFAAVREASVRTLKMRPFDVQLVGGMVLHEGKIAEMATGEGKTLAATLPAYLNALTGRGVHIVTVNDYLAKRDAEWMGHIYTALGLTVGLIVPDQDPDTKRAAYACDITYGTNNEFGFDYLRDNMVLDPEHMVQRGFAYAIVDEVDSILIDEARTPLIISGLGTDSTDWYRRFAQVVAELTPEVDYKVDEKNRQVAPTEEGVEKVERMLGVEHLYADAETDLSHYLNQALKARALFHRDRDYMVKDGEVIIVDEFTGRLMIGRRYNEGLHQAIEAKEGVAIQQENPTLASITFQNYFRMYPKLAGMTGTAQTEEEEFRKIYGLDVVTIPTNRPMIRTDMSDLVYKTENAKFKAVAEDVRRRHETGQPVLVGTVSIEKSERLSEMLTRRGIPHQVLNARYHEQEAQIIAKAGQKSAVTIATNMAGRGTDIVLGPGVQDLGGLHVLGTERHEARRIDNQLRGRSGRQGDPGSSQFYVSLDDDLMRIFASDTIRGILDRLGLEEDDPIESPMLTRAIENAQRKVENRNFEARKQTLDYDDVLNRQRQVLYSERRRVLTDEAPETILQGFVDELVDEALAVYCPEKARAEEWDVEGLVTYLEQVLIPPHTLDPDTLRAQGIEAIREDIQAVAADALKVKWQQLDEGFGEGFARQYIRRQILSTIDRLWPEHLTLMDDLREGVFLRSYGQRDPLVEYTREAFDMFQEMVDGIRENSVRVVYKTPAPDPTRLIMPAQFMPPGVAIPVAEPGTVSVPLVIGQQPGVAIPGVGGVGPVMLPPGAMLVDPQGRPIGVVGLGQGQPDVGRNDPCPCGSGRKFKKCHGKSA